MTAGAVVEARALCRRFDRGADEIWAVRDVTLRVESGEMLALVGRSGSGKTTLLNLLGGLDQPTSGEVLLDGVRIDTMAERELTGLRRARLGFVFQSFGLLPLLSAQENVELPLRIAGVAHRERVRRARAALESVGLTRRVDHRPYELSGGEQQRVAIARAIASEPAVIFADEPTGELDSATALAVFGLLRTLAHERGITVITCTHDRLVMERADRVEELADGRIVTGRDREVWEHAQRGAPLRAPGQQAAGSGLAGRDPSAAAWAPPPRSQPLPLAVPPSASPNDAPVAPVEPPSRVEPDLAVPASRHQSDADINRSRWGRPR